jgi:hypothetical protein
MTGWYSLEVLKANKLRRQAKELELTIRRSRTVRSCGPFNPRVDLATQRPEIDRLSE